MLSTEIVVTGKPLVNNRVLLSTVSHTTVPYIAMYEEEVVATRNQIVTLICTPSDVRAPVLWNLE